MMLGLNVPDKAFDGGHCHIVHLSLTDKRRWSITSDYRPRDYAEQVTQVLNNSLACGRHQHTAFVCTGKNAHLSTDAVQSDESEKTMPPFVFDDDDDGHIWLGDTDFLHDSDDLCTCTQKVSWGLPLLSLIHVLPLSRFSFRLIHNCGIPLLGVSNNRCLAT